jgi:hypothetical protein
VKKRLGLGVAPFCLPSNEPSMSDKVTYGEMLAELDLLRAAITLLTSRLVNELGTDDARRIMEYVRPPHERF